MKVWFPTIQGGSGADVFTRRLAAALQRHGIVAEVSWFPTYFQFGPFLLRSASPPSDTNIIHAHSWSGFAFKKPGLALVVTKHLDVLDPRYRPYRSLAQQIYHETLIRTYTKASFKAASSVTAVSHSTAASVTRMLPAQSIRVIYNSVNTQIFHPGKPADRGHRPFRLLFVGNLTRRKGADLLAPIMRRLGDGFELYYTAGLRSSNLKYVTTNMKPLGKITAESELVATYHQCDVLLFPSRLEGLPLAPLEAMACAKPVIASRISSLPEVIEDGVSGILCEPNNINAFTSACRKLAGCPEIGRAYGEAGRNRVERLFSEDVVIPQYISLYEGLADRENL